jgi:hypothetical protein
MIALCIAANHAVVERVIQNSNAVECAKHRSRSDDAVIRVYDAAGNVIETHEHKGVSTSGVNLMAAGAPSCFAHFIAALCTISQSMLAL